MQNAQRAIDQVGSTAQLQFYDWEPNVLGDRGPDAPYAGSKALFEAVEVASKQKPKAEQDDVPPGSDESPQEADKNNDSTSDQYYLFGPDRLPIGPDKQPLREGDYDPSVELQGPPVRLRPATAPNKYAKDTECMASSRRWARPARRTARASSRCRRASWSWRPSRRRTSPPRVHRFFVIEDDSELSGRRSRTLSRTSTRTRTPRS